jgi:citrate lyase subunit beta/citryl-CoA lyase
MLRSLLFVPGDNEKMLAGAARHGADALVLDLEDSVTAARRDAARGAVAAYIRSRRDAGPALWVRINPLGGPDWQADLAAVLLARPAGVMLPKADSQADVVALAQALDGPDPAATVGILPIITETPAGALSVAGYAAGAPRLRGLAWGAEDLGAALGVTARRDGTGAWLPLFEQLRASVRLAAAAAGVPAIDTVFTALDDAAGLERAIAAARTLGFAGMLAIHPRQVEAINRGFAPTPAELDEARRIVAAFAAARGAGVVRLDGRMLDRPHLARAQALLAAAR